MFITEIEINLSYKFNVVSHQPLELLSPVLSVLITRWSKLGRALPSPDTYHRNSSAKYFNILSYAYDIPTYPTYFLVMDSSLVALKNNKLVCLFYKNVEMFASPPNDMTHIDINIIFYLIMVDPLVKHLKEKTHGKERIKFVDEEV